MKLNVRALCAACVAVLLCAVAGIAGEPLFSLPEEDGQAYRSQVLTGTWQYGGAGCTTTIECLANGTMQVSQKSARLVRTWQGTYATSGNQIRFSVSALSERRGFSCDSRLVAETWLLSYEAGAGMLAVWSADIPADAGGHDFSSRTEFTAR